MDGPAKNDSAPVIVLKDGTVGVEHLDEIGFKDWPQYQKVALTRAARVSGPFEVVTSEGPLRCQDGYLAVDARGYPYPIAVDEFQQIYVPAGAQTSANDHAKAILDRIDDLVDNEQRPGERFTPEAHADLQEARRWLNLGITMFNSAVYRINGTWGRADAERVVGWIRD